MITLSNYEEECMCNDKNCIFKKYRGKDVKEFIRLLKGELSGVNFYALLGTEGANKVKELIDKLAGPNLI